MPYQVRHRHLSAAGASAGRRVATAEACLAEEIQRRRNAEAETPLIPMHRS